MPYEEFINVRKELETLQIKFDEWKKLHEYELYMDDYKALAYQQMEVIISLRQKLEERDKQCAD
jgi:hypothetical protein